MDTSPSSTPVQPGSGRLVLGSVLVAIVCASALLATSPWLPMAWDEGNAIWRAAGIQHWARRWVSGRDDGQPHPLSRQAIATDWYYTTEIEGRQPKIEGHPAFYGIVIAAGRWPSWRRLSPLQSARFGPILLFGLAAGAMFCRISRDYSTAAGLGAVAALMLMPRMFAHAHFASFDGPLTSCWILAWAAFGPGRRRWWAAVFFGIALGMTLSCKVTGWIAPIPFAVWTILYRDRPALVALAVGLPVALVTFFLLNPPLWHDPIGGLITFFRMNLDRGAFNISTQFFGRLYNLDYPLPWYNTLVWTAITVPVGTLLLIAVGVAAVLRAGRSQPAGTLLLANALVLLIVRALPIAPPHDGVRLFLPSFAFLAAVAGVGCVAILAGCGGAPSAGEGHRRMKLAAVLLLYAGSASSLLWYAPQWLSYYNLSIGGLPGAAAAGMEPTYYWDALDQSVLDWLDRHTGPHEKVRFGAASGENLELMRRWGTLPFDFRPEAPGRYRWYVLQHRPSGWQPADRWLIRHGRPACRKTIRQDGWGPWRLDVPLVEVYAYERYAWACKAARAR